MEVLKFKQTKDYIAQALREQILSGTIPDGEKLTQEQISEKLGVSRIPVREAMQILELEGFLERLPNRHMRVIGVKKEDIYINFRVLSALESEIATMLLEEGADISLLAKILDEYKVAVEQEQWRVCAEKELDFHIHISQLLENKCLIKLHEKLVNGYLSYGLKHFPMNWQVNLDSLYKVLQVLESGEEKLLREFFDNYFKEVAAVMMKGG
ncbi:MAG: GntR family transcriptional regulator [Clostridia bacterium]|nr:GntR family transcriptional regulator [Clostridia bacterium]